MAGQQHHWGVGRINFKSVQLLKTQSLGIGSYGSVCKALCDDLLCAAKIIHPTLFDPNAHQQIEPKREHRLPISRFIQECEFMSAINHPNIVQFLGTCQDPETSLPVLLMELMDDNLTHFLESSQEAIPYHIQVNFCHDITLAISYLHLNRITHRDLSSNNVLLYGNVKAKVTDFGMAKLGAINPRAMHINSFTLCPGTEAYMPPEAVQDPPIYTEKIDCFSIGTLIIQILTKCFPEPGERHKIVQTTDPPIEARVSEIERRQNHISQVDPNHPLLPIALHCLKDNDVKRPSAQELCHRIAAMKETPQFTESVRRAQERLDDRAEREELQQQVQDKDEEIRQLRDEHAEQIQGLQQTIGFQNDRLQEKDDIIQQKDDIVQQKNDVIQLKDDIVQKTIASTQQECQQLREQLQHVTQQLELSEQVTAQFQTRIQELEQQQKKASQTEVPTTPSPSYPALAHPPWSTTDSATIDNITLKWRKGKKVPSRMARACNAIVNRHMMYLSTSDDDQTIYAYNSTNETWSKVAKCGMKYFSLAVVNNLLTIIGGENRSGIVTNQLFSFIGQGRTYRWREVFQSMPTKRSRSITLCTEQALIVAGGIDQNGKELRTVEVMDTVTEKWSSVADLPQPLFSASITIYHDRICILGGFYNNKATKSVYLCILSDLIQSKSSEEHALALSRANRFSIWERAADLPIKLSTCVTLHGRLLAIGGIDLAVSSNVLMYQPKSNTWEIVSQMGNGHCKCFAAVLPNNELIVVGGSTPTSFFNETDSVEIAIAV